MNVYMYVNVIAINRLAIEIKRKKEEIHKHREGHRERQRQRTREGVRLGRGRTYICTIMEW